MNAVIDVRDLTRCWRLGQEDVYALRGVTLSIDRGDYVAIMGPSGSGKTTLMNIIGLLDTPSAGSYVLNGREVSGLADSELSDIRNREIGFVFQTFNLMPDATALQNVELPMVYGRTPRGERRGRALEAIDRVGLAKRARHRPVELSGGERQRIAIARALVNRPSVVLADEPTGNLDTATGHRVIELLFDLNAANGTTLVLVTHDREIAGRCGRVIELDAGHMIRDS
jgi:putative ABC transport system ATP-binding protein